MSYRGYIRPFVLEIERRFSKTVPLIQVLIGPRPVGKTTGVKQLIKKMALPSHYVNADDVLASDRSWLLGQWQQASLLGKGTLLVIDEIQKIPNWQETVKALWDARPRHLRVLLLGSSALDIQNTVTESLAGRFEMLRAYHWTFTELKKAFRYDLKRYLVYGGYPSSVALESEPERWYAYMKDAIVESVIGRDILQSRRVTNPALFRQAFEILCQYPAQEISYTKLLGQLQDKGNTDLVKYYIELYNGAFLLHTLQKYSPKAWLSRSSSPKMLSACPALHGMVVRLDTGMDAEQYGRAFELAVGAELMQQPGKLFYWRERNDEVDFVYTYANKVYAIEVKSGRKKSAKGLMAFKVKEPKALQVIITPETFAKFSENPQVYLEQIAV